MTGSLQLLQVFSAPTGTDQYVKMCSSGGLRRGRRLPAGALTLPASETILLPCPGGMSPKRALW